MRKDGPLLWHALLLLLLLLLPLQSTASRPSVVLRIG
jgi:hypothetical protein